MATVSGTQPSLFSTVHPLCFTHELMGKILAPPRGQVWKGSLYGKGMCDSLKTHGDLISSSPSLGDKWQMEISQQVTLHPPLVKGPKEQPWEENNEQHKL